MKTIIILFFSIISFVFPLNLTLVDYHDPTANHILDAEVINDILIISAMVQGIEFYDISNPNNLNHLTNFNLSSGGGGGGGGGGSKSNCVKASGNYAYFTSSNGIYTVNISNPSNPQNLGQITGTNNLELEDLDIVNNLLAVCAHSDGVFLYDISNPSNPNYITTIESGNAWTVAIYNDFLYWGDNSQLRIADITQLHSPNQINSLETGNAIKDISIDNDFLYLALGTGGINIYNLDNPSDPEFLDNYNTSTLANKITNFNDKLAVADWDDVEILEWDGNDLIQIGYKNTGNRTMSIASKNNFIYSAEWASVQAFQYGAIEGPDIDLNTWELNYPYVENGNNFSLLLEVVNNGNSELIISDNYTTNSEFVIVNPLSNLLPGEMQIIEIIYNASSSNASGSYRIFSNDVDEPQIICETNGNIDGANIGEPAPDFELSYVANGNGNFILSDNLGNIIVLAFFAPN